MKLGFDIGSTTIKSVLLNSYDETLYKIYKRHYGNINESLVSIINDIENKFGNIDIYISFTGTAGLGVAEKLKVKFIQELIAASDYISHRIPDVNALIDIGGEDSKIIIFDENRGNDLRMNGGCAGGTGSFLDQLANLLDLTLEEVDKFAGEGNKIYNIASRCGVFAKTDVQNLVSNGVPLNDVCYSIFKALSIQIKNTLLRGSKINGKILFTGGPLTFLPNLRKSISEEFGLQLSNTIILDDSLYISAIGSTLNDNNNHIINLKEFKKQTVNSLTKEIINVDNSLKPLFKSFKEYQAWKNKKNSKQVTKISLKDITNKSVYVGIDSGSTTTKIVAIDDNKSLAFKYYSNNKGKPIETVKNGLIDLLQKLKENGIEIKGIAVTGYGENLIKSAFGIDLGIVETIAHYKAGQQFIPDVTFILDIGGQDMKAIFIENGIIKNIEINEACSSGCGSFIENFSNTLNLTVEKFAEKAILSKKPCDLGTRCTVFMNSKVKQYFREGAGIDDISAGLAYSVVNNSLQKVLKIYDNKILGDKIVVQGGAFKNEAVHKAFENIIGKEVINPDISELMGAYGVAIYALEQSQTNKKFQKFSIENVNNFYSESKEITCKGCENNCKIIKFKFNTGLSYFTGNKCENYFSNDKTNLPKGQNLVDYKLKLLFDRERIKPKNPIFKIGIPRVLTFYDNFPFWHTLFTELNIEVILSSNLAVNSKYNSEATFASDNICYPAKIVNKHIKELISKGVDRIFYPFINFEKNEIKNSINSFNCPIVAGFSSVIKSSFIEYNNIIDSPNINLKDNKVFYNGCEKYLVSLGFNKEDIKTAFQKALKIQSNWKNELKLKAKEIIENAERDNRKVFVLNSRPYQLDYNINHGIPKIIANYGYDVITEDSLPYDTEKFDEVFILTQWAFANRTLRAAQFVSTRKNLELIHLNSFGCGPDTIYIDEIREYLVSKEKIFSVIRIDEHSAFGSIKLRVRSLIESIKLKNENYDKTSSRITTKVFTSEDKDRIIIVPFFSPFHSAYVSAAFYEMGYKVVQLPPSDKSSIELGLKYVNNEICYPALLVIGDVLKAINSGEFDTSKLAVGITQTGGQCRASNYLSLLKKALVKNGYENIPVIGVTLTNKKLNEQPGFKLNKVKFIRQALIGLLFGDVISRMYYSIAPREKVKGTAKKLSEKYSEIAQEFIVSSDKNTLLTILKQAVNEFNQVKIIREKIPKIGVVGEIYVKFNPVGNNFSVEYLIEKGVEPVLPPLIDFFSQWFVNINIKNDENIERKPIAKKFSKLFEQYYNYLVNEFEQVYKEFRFYIKQEQLRDLAKLAKQTINLGSHYFGEGWLISGEILGFAKQGIYNILCLQPFGCIANQIVAKGVEKAIKEIEPKLNILFLDIDHNISEVNIHNRLELMIKNSEKYLETESSIY